ncbi:EthD domain-containing protein [Patulibacter sp. NPDC049589]|uniref:EthD domain-containing protein n=1 Tax=Patulibacter sp. NPDC049589 TaxID=3154731 RepID=UPI00341C21FE
MPGPTSVTSVYLARRHPSLTRDAFPARWRRHGALAMSLGLWEHSERYVHCDVEEHPPVADDPYLPGAWTGEHDGIGLVTMPSVPAMRRLSTAPDFPILLADECTAFAAPIPSGALVTRQVPHLDRPGTAAKVFAFVTPRDGVTREAFQERWTAHAARVMGDVPLRAPLLRYVHDVVLPIGPGEVVEATERSRPEGVLADVAGVAELGFASAAARASYLSHPGRKAVVADLAEFADLDRLLLIATNEVVLDDRSGVAVA